MVDVGGAGPVVDVGGTLVGVTATTAAVAVGAGVVNATGDFDDRSTLNTWIRLLPVSAT